MLKKMAAIVIGLLALLLGAVATRPSQFRVQRSASIGAPPELVFPLIDDLHEWESWSPWDKLDLGMRKKYSGAARGEGATYDWSGNDEVGVGSMRITSSEPPRRVTIQLQFKEPWQATNVTTFELRPVAPGTEVTWVMAGQNSFMAKAASLFVDMDALIGKDFETGLSQLRALAEARATGREP
jgi:uncharacterized protein YndB with AHSA1/START domain